MVWAGMGRYGLVWVDMSSYEFLYDMMKYRRMLRVMCSGVVWVGMGWYGLT